MARSSATMRRGLGGTHSGSATIPGAAIPPGRPGSISAGALTARARGGPSISAARQALAARRSPTRTAASAIS